LRVAHEAGALRSQDLKRVTVDTTVQPKAISFPTDAKLLHAAIRGLNRLARKHGIRLRQSYSRAAKAAAMMAGRYAHAKQFKRHQRQGAPRQYSLTRTAAFFCSCVTAFHTFSTRERSVSLEARAKAPRASSIVS
jgi:hypothetical protein